jgi:hypothetical protein
MMHNIFPASVGDRVDPRMQTVAELQYEIAAAEAASVKAFEEDVDAGGDLNEAWRLHGERFKVISQKKKELEAMLKRGPARA